MQPLYGFIDSLGSMPLWQAAALVTLANVAMFFVALIAGDGLVRRMPSRRVSPLPGVLTNAELWLATICVVLNA
ncbi:MAG TPA: hypothetical protein VHI52_13085, partial [Verrucomicrobiae bacterium]|nr:hypothetical protein [Verrucomicrobiae bacterium]